MICSTQKFGAAILCALLLPWLATAQDHEGGFLGVHVAPVLPEVRAQADLPEDGGLLIDFIEANSPAEKAGIALYDILVKFADQRILNSEQFVALIRSGKPGQEVELTVLRKNKEIPLKVTLGTAPPRIANSAPTPAESAFDFDRALLEMLRHQPDGHRVLQEIVKRLKAADAKSGLVEAADRRIAQTDAEGSVEILEREGKQRARVKDAAGGTLFDGEITTPEQRSALKPEVRHRIEQAEESARLAGKR